MNTTATSSTAPVVAPVLMKASEIVDRDIVVIDGEHRTVDFAFVLPATNEMCVDFEGYDRDENGQPEAYFSNTFAFDADVLVIRAPKTA